MLYISKWKAAAIMLTAFVVCLFAVPNFFPGKHVSSVAGMGAAPHRSRPRSAGRFAHPARGRCQRRAPAEGRIAARRGPQGDARRAHRADRRAGRSAAIRVDVRVRESDLQQGLTKLRELSQPLGGFLGSTGHRSLDVVNVGGGLIQLTVTEPAILERVRQVVAQSVEIIERRVNQLGLVEPSIQPQGADRILVQVPGLGRPAAADRHPRQDRQADVPPGRHVDDGRAGAAGAAAAGIGDCLRLARPKAAGPISWRSGSSSRAKN